MITVTSVSLRCVLVVFASCAADFCAADEPRFFVTSIARDFEIVTQVSDAAPFVGQQISVIYSLRASRSPAAVDIDPQQYSGFWTESARLPDLARSTVRVRDGRREIEYLLRQVIAFPLWQGPHELPPLRVKVKSADSRADAWDLVGSSNSVSIAARALPPVERPAGPPYLVGDLEGTLSRDGHGTRSDLVLELKGSANLALYQPSGSLSASRDVRWSIRLRDWENTLQTRDTGGQRHLSLLQWRRWTIRPTAMPAGPMRIDDLIIPVFHPDQGRWAAVRIRGLELEGISTAPPSDAVETELTRKHDSRSSPMPARTIVILSILLLVLLTLWLATMKRKPRGHRDNI